MDNDVYEPLTPSRRVNAGKEDGKGADGKFDATSLLKLLGESYNLKESSGGAERLETKGDGNETRKTTVGDRRRAVTTTPTAVEPTSPPIGGRRTPYEFVMLKDENVKQRTAMRETVTTKREQNYNKSVTFNANEASMVGDSDSPALAKPPCSKASPSPRISPSAFVLLCASASDAIFAVSTSLSLTNGMLVCSARSLFARATMG